MKQRLHDWLHTIPIADPFQLAQALLLQTFLLGVMGTGVIGLPISLAAMPGEFGLGHIATLVAYAMVVAIMAYALALLRRARFDRAVQVAVMGLLAILLVSVMLAGLPDAAAFIFTLAVPIALAGLLGSRAILLQALVISVAGILVVAALEYLAPQLVFWLPLPPHTFTGVLLTIFLITMALLGFLLDRFGLSLREALTAALARQQDLERMRSSQEQVIAERTAALEEALQVVKQREARLEQTLADLQASQAAIRELSAPVIPVMPGVLVAPLTGSLDSQRAILLAENLLGTIERTRARHVIFDVTGVPVVDTYVGQVLLRTAAAARLLGANAMLVGIRPEVAETIVTLNLDLADLRTYPTLQEAIAVLGRRA